MTSLKRINKWPLSKVLATLEGKPRECIGENPADVEEILQKLSDRIKTKNSRVVEVRMKALATSRTSLQEFPNKYLYLLIIKSI